MTTAARSVPIWDRWWFGHALLFAMCGGIMFLAVIMHPGPDVVTLFGEPVPMLCSFRRLTGYPCPGCGMTRSFVYMAHGQVLEAFRMHLAGPPFFAFLAAQVPFQAWKLYSGWQRRQQAR